MVGASWRRTFLGLAVLVLGAQPAFAQYQWRDADGKMVFSDQPPPTSVARDRIIKAPAAAPASAPSSANAPASQPAAGNAGGPAVRQVPTGARPAGPVTEAGSGDKALSDKMKAQKANEEAKKKQEENERMAKLAKACDETRANLRSLDSGMRIARVSKSGETEFLSDDERSARAAGLRKDIAESCRGL